MSVVRNIVDDPRIVPGGGATEMHLAADLMRRSQQIPGSEAEPYRCVAEALEVIPRTLIHNCGESPIKLLTQLRAKHAEEANQNIGIDGMEGKIVDMTQLAIWEPYMVKSQTIKTAIESACMLLRIDEIVPATKSKGQEGGRPQAVPEDDETFGDSRDG